MAILDAVSRYSKQCALFFMGVLIVCLCPKCLGQDTIRIVWLEEFVEHLKTHDRLATDGCALLNFRLCEACRELLSHKKIALRGIQSVMVQHEAGEQASGLIDEKIRLKKVPAKDVDFFILTTYTIEAHEYDIVSTIFRPVISSDTIKSFFQVETPSTDKIPRRVENGEVVLTSEDLTKLANDLADGIHRQFQGGYAREPLAVFPSQVKDVNSFLSQERRSDYALELLKKLIIKLRDYGAGEIKRASSDTSADASLDVEIESDPVDTLSYDITAEISMKKDESVVASAERTFTKRDKDSHLRAVNEIVQALVDQLNKYLEKSALSH